MEPPDTLRAFRRSFYECLHRRKDALFELADAILAADGAAPSPAHLSLQAPHRCGWGSLYAALDRGQIDAEGLRGLLVRHPLARRSETTTPVYAVDVSVWNRCDTEISPERGYYYHPSKHSAGQPIVAGWAYQVVAELNFVRESWTAPVDVERVRPAQDANVVAAEQVRSFVRRSLPPRRRDAAPHEHPFAYEHLRYEGAGHMITLPGYEPESSWKQRYELGGNREADEFANADSWSKVLGFLGKHLRPENG